MKRSGFTLIEIVVVLCIMSLLASGGMLLLSSQLKAAQRRGAEADFLDLHRIAARQSANQPATVEIDLTGKNITLKSQDRSGDNRQIELPALEALVIDGAILDAGNVRVEYTLGGCKGYAILLASRNLVPGKTGKWIVVCGPSGLIHNYTADSVSAQQIAQWQTAWTHLN